MIVAHLIVPFRRYFAVAASAVDYYHHVPVMGRAISPRSPRLAAKLLLAIIAAAVVVDLANAATVKRSPSPSPKLAAGAYILVRSHAQAVGSCTLWHAASHRLRMACLIRMTVRVGRAAVVQAHKQRPVVKSTLSGFSTSLFFLAAAASPSPKPSVSVLTPPQPDRFILLYNWRQQHTLQY